MHVPRSTLALNVKLFKKGKCIHGYFKKEEHAKISGKQTFLKFLFKKLTWGRKVFHNYWSLSMDSMKRNISLNTIKHDVKQTSKGINDVR